MDLQNWKRDVAISSVLSLLAQEETTATAYKDLIYI